MEDKKQDYTITVSGPGHNFERPVDEATAGQILALIMTGAVTSSNARATGGHPAIGASTPAGATPPTQAAKNVSLAAYIKAKKGENSQVIVLLPRRLGSRVAAMIRLLQRPWRGLYQNITKRGSPIRLTV